MADQQVRAEAVEQPEKRRRFTLPSAYTILFALIVLVAIATWLVPAGAYRTDEAGSPLPGRPAPGNPAPARSAETPRYLRKPRRSSTKS